MTYTPGFLYIEPIYNDIIISYWILNNATLNGKIKYPHAAVFTIGGVIWDGQINEHKFSRTSMSMEGKL